MHPNLNYLLTLSSMIQYSRSRLHTACPMLTHTLWSVESVRVPMSNAKCKLWIHILTAPMLTSWTQEWELSHKWSGRHQTPERWHSCQAFLLTSLG
eukprot:scaffold31888_cov62-Attheya_sp.AAC.1